MDYRQAMKQLGAALLTAAALFAAPPAEWEELLKRVTAGVARNFDSIHNYTCVETVRRDYFRPAGSTLSRACPVLLELRKHPTLDMVLQPFATDRLRLDVTTSSRGEIHAWAGASRFEDADIDHVVHDGAIGSGALGALLDIIFEMDVKEFQFTRASVVDGRRVLEYSFEVPEKTSHYRIRFQDGKTWYSAAYSGTVLVDAQTADPVQLTVRTGELPLATGSCEMTTTLHLTRATLGDRRLIIPERASQHFITPIGTETENTVSFSRCREYTSESTITFSPAPGTDATRAAPDPLPTPRRIPDGLVFTFELNAAIDSDTAAAGDRFTGKLTAPLRDGKTLLSPRGALVEGRLSMVKMAYSPKEQVLLGLMPETIEVQGRKVPVNALPDSRAVRLLRSQARNKSLEIYLPPPGEHAGVFTFPGKRAIMPRRFVSEWRTVAPWQ
jgi:hypothetical protein